MLLRPRRAPPAELPLTLDADASIHTGVYDALRSAVLEGRLRSGARLPSTRDLAAQLGVARGSVVAAFERLSAEGYVATRVGAGTFVASTLPDAWFRAPAGDAVRARRPAGPRLSARGRSLARSPFPFSLSDAPATWPKPFRAHAPAVAEFPHGIWARLVARHARRPTATLLATGDPRGLRPLREALADHLRMVRGVDAPANRIVIVPSVQQALQIAALATLDPGDAAWVEDPGYAGAAAALRAAGARVVPVAVDAHGLDVARGVARAPDARIAYVTPAHQAPLGMTMPAARRLALLDWAESNGAWVFEDDYDSEFRYEGPPLAALARLDRTSTGSVIHAGSFSKTLFPAVRLAYAVVPDGLIGAFLALKATLDRYTQPLLQAVVADFLAEGHFARHLRRMRVLYAERRAALLTALAAELDGAAGAVVVGSSAGLDLTVRFPGVDDAALVAALARESVEAVALSSQAIAAPRPAGLVLGFAAFPPARLRRAAAVLGRVVRRM